MSYDPNAGSEMKEYFHQYRRTSSTIQEESMSSSNNDGTSQMILNLPTDSYSPGVAYPFGGGGGQTSPTHAMYNAAATTIGSSNLSESPSTINNPYPTFYPAVPLYSDNLPAGTFYIQTSSGNVMQSSQIPATVQAYPMAAVPPQLTMVPPEYSSGQFVPTANMQYPAYFPVYNPTYPYGVQYEVMPVMAMDPNMQVMPLTQMASAVEPVANKPRKGRRRKEPGAPKNPLSGYLFFITEQRAKLAGHNTKSFKDLAKDLGTQWKQMTDEEKEPYQEMARRDKNRYLKEKKAYENQLTSAASSNASPVGTGGISSPPVLADNNSEDEVGSDHGGLSPRGSADLSPNLESSHVSSSTT